MGLVGLGGVGAPAALYLASAGVPDARLASSGLGFEKPVATNDTQAGRAENRRVEIVRRAS